MAAPTKPQYLGIQAGLTPQNLRIGASRPVSGCLWTRRQAPSDLYSVTQTNLTY